MSLLIETFNLDEDIKIVQTTIKTVPHILNVRINMTQRKDILLKRKS